MATGSVLTPGKPSSKVNINSLSNNSAGAALRMGCIGDGNSDGLAGCSGGPDDYALGIGVSSCYDGYNCNNVGNSDNLHYRDAGNSGTYNQTAFIYVK